MDGSVGTATEVKSKKLFGACCHLLAAGGGKLDAVAGEVGAGGVERWFDCVAFDGDGGGHEHVCLCAEREAGCEEEAEWHVCGASRRRRESDCWENVEGEVVVVVVVVV